LIIVACYSQHKDATLDQKLREKIYQQFALCTYKDQDLPADERLDRALEILAKDRGFRPRQFRKRSV